MFDCQVKYRGDRYRVTIDPERKLDNGHLCMYWNCNGGPVSRADVNPPPAQVTTEAMLRWVDVTSASIAALVGAE